MKELIEIQTRLKAPKAEYNQYGKYKYRKAEQILEQVKPILQEVKCVILLNDEMVQVGDRYYVKATATIKNEKGDTESATGWAREALTLAGMSDGQITGATSSYARKYALCGLLAIDDTKDLDDPDITNPKKKDTASLEKACDEMRKAKNIDEVKAVWAKYPQYKGEQDFIDICTSMGEQYKGE